MVRERYINVWGPVHTVAAAITSVTWQQRAGDAALYTTVLDRVAAESVTQCGILCHNLPRCFGFDWRRTDRECILHDGGAMTINTPQTFARGQEQWQNFGEICFVSIR